MNPLDKRAAMNWLLYELESMIEEHHLSIRNDEVFTVKKKIRMRLKEIQQQILLLQEEQRSFFVHHITHEELQQI